MANPYWDEHGDHNLSKKSTHKDAKKPSHKQKPDSASFKQHPCHDAPAPDCKLP